jgi:hypothetical protein
MYALFRDDEFVKFINDNKLTDYCADPACFAHKIQNDLVLNNPTWFTAFLNKKNEVIIVPSDNGINQIEIYLQNKLNNTLHNMSFWDKIKVLFLNKKVI